MQKWKREVEKGLQSENDSIKSYEDEGCKFWDIILISGERQIFHAFSKKGQKDNTGN